MGLFSKLFGRGGLSSGGGSSSGSSSGSSFGASPGGDQTPEHAVLLRLVYDVSGAGLPDEESVFAMHALQDRLAEAIVAAGAGELDGDEFGEGVCTVYLYGPDAARLWEAIAPVLEIEPFLEGSVAIKRFGAPGSREERVDLTWRG